MILPLPANKVAFGDQPLSPDLMDSLFKMIRGKKKPFLGLFQVESGAKQLIFFILESDPYAATLLEEEAARAEEGCSCSRDLSGPASPLQLYHCFVDVAGALGAALREAAAVGIHRDAPVDLDSILRNVPMLA